MRDQFFRLALAVGLLVGLVGLPASADITDTGTFDGTAEVGKTFLATNDCDKTGNAQVVGEGLYFAGSPLDLGRERQGAWHLHTNAMGVLLGVVELEVCGWLGPLDGTVLNNEDRNSGLGPACVASKGHHGMGEIRDLAGIPILKLMDLGWKDSVGDVLVMTGKYQQYVTDAKGTTKRQKFGTMAAQVFAPPRFPNDCFFESPGAQQFNMFATFELVNTGYTNPPKPPDKEMLPFTRKDCKATDPNTDKVKDTTQKRECPTARK